MTAVFRSCLPRFSSNTNQSNSFEDDDDENSMDCLSIISNQNTTTTTPQLNSSSYKQISRTKKRGPRYSRINEKTQPLLTRLVGTIFGDYQIPRMNNKKQRSKKSLLPSKSTINKQFEENEQTLHSLITLLTQIESNIKLTSSTDITSMEKESPRNNNRIDDISNEISSPKSKITKRHNKKGVSSLDRKMIDNQQQTQLYPPKINIGTSTQLNDLIPTEPSWLDIMREDQTTINAWSRIRRRLKPNQQKDILRALMIICANLFEVPLENKHM